MKIINTHLSRKLFSLKARFQLPNMCSYQKKMEKINFNLMLWLKHGYVVFGLFFPFFCYHYQAFDFNNEKKMILSKCLSKLPVYMST